MIIQPSEVPAPPPSRSCEVLVVDDDRPSRDGLRAALAGRGHRIETAGDAWQAIARLRRQRFDLAIVDLDLPPVHGMDLGGWDVARIARAYQRGIVLVLLSAEDDPTAQNEADALGGTQILTKPISLWQLTALVEGRPASASRTRK